MSMHTLNVCIRVAQNTLALDGSRSNELDHIASSSNMILIAYFNFNSH